MAGSMNPQLDGTAARRHRPNAATRRRGRPDPLLRATWLLVLAAAVWVAVQDVGVANQFALAVTALGGLILMNVLKVSRAVRLLFIVLAGFITLRYLAWRVTDTLPAADTLSFVPGVMLFAAELYGIAMYFFGVFVNINPVDREIVPLPEDPSLLPSVDVFVPSYNEDPALLEVTLIAARQIRYPADKLNVYLLDDGGTEQKRADPDPAKAAAARRRHEELRLLCERVGACYLTRAENRHAKAGNINAALPKTSGELIVILDADHVPTQDFLENTVGQFLRDPKLFLVQTPHFMLNPDPVERNLDTFHRMPSEGEMFYAVAQRGLDFWNASFFCGSAAVLRRTCLEEVGGIQGTSITEDAETALELHARGYNSAYINVPMIAGLAPETFAGFIGQRTRWAQGMMQILLLKNPLLKRGLTLPQRICYLSSSVFWLFPLARAAFLVTPLAYLFLGMQIYDASLDEFVAYAIPHVLCSQLLANQLFGRVRWPFISELYEMTQALFLAPALVSVLLRPRRPQFKVTAKAETLQSSFLSQLAWPVFAMWGLLVAGAAAGVYRYLHYPLEHENLAIVLAWNTINLLFMFGALGVVYERAQRRQHPRMPRSQPVELAIGGGTFGAMISDLSTSGAQIALSPDAAVHGHLNSGEAVIRTELPGGAPGELHALQVQVRHAVVEDDRVWLGVRFTPASDAEQARLVRLCYGSSAAWAGFLASRQRTRSVFGGLVFFVALSLYHGTASLFAALRQKADPSAAAELLAPAAQKRVAMQIGGDD